MSDIAVLIIGGLFGGVLYWIGQWRGPWIACAAVIAGITIVAVIRAVVA
jgi:hypothetical protein